MNSKQWERVYGRVYRRVVVRDCFGADWRTLMVVNPQGYVALRLAYDGIRLADHKARKAGGA